VAQPAPFRLPDAPARSALVARYFRALGDPTRLRILGLLRDLAQGQHSLRGLPEEAWVRQALQDAQARRREPGLAALDAAITGFLDQAAVAEGIGARLNRLLFGFLEAEVLPQAMRAAEVGIDPTPLLDVVATVLRMYADGLERSGHGAD